MEHVVCRTFADPVQVEVVRSPTPRPGRGEVLVEVDAAGVSFVDGLVAQGRYQVRPALPYTPGSTAAGTVVAIGDDVTSPRVGDAVATLLMAYGAFSSHLVLPANDVVGLPEGVAPEIAATAIENYSTVVFAVTRRVAIEPGSEVVVLGAGGGIGLAAVDVAHQLGAHVVAVASSPEKRDAALAAGADAAIDYADLKDTIRAATAGGADVVLDPVGGPASESALRALGTGGRLCVIGFAAGEIPRLPANIVLLRNRSIVGVDWGDWARSDHRGALELVSDVLGRISRGEVHPPRPQVLPIAEAAAALRMYGERAVTGRIALRP